MKLTSASIALGLTGHALATIGTEGIHVPLKQQSKPPLDGPKQLRKTYNKYGWKLPPKPLPGSNIPNPRIELPTTTTSGIGFTYATPQAFASEYLCQAMIGNQMLMLDFDTGSTDLWVFSTYLNQSTIGGGHVLYDSNASSTFTLDQGESWQVIYADGSSASGIVGFDRVAIGTATQTVQAIELATAVSQSFVDENGDGVFGLGFDNLNKVQPRRVRSWFQQMKSKLYRRVFSVNLREDGSGYFKFGIIDTSAYVGSLTRVPIDMSRGAWQFNSTSFALNGTTIYRGNVSSPGIADTGTTLLIVDDAVAAYYYQQVPNSGYSYDYGGYLFPCSHAATLPSFGISMGSPDFIVNIPLSLLTYGPVDDYYCYGSIQGNNGYGLQIYGDVLYRSAFIAHLDWRNTPGTLGFLGLSVGAKSPA